MAALTPPPKKRKNAKGDPLWFIPEVVVTQDDPSWHKWWFLYFSNSYFKCAEKYILKFNFLCIPESFNTNILHQLFDYKITFVIHSRRTQIPKLVLYSKPVLNVCFNDFWVKYIYYLSAFYQNLFPYTKYISITLGLY